MSHCLGASRLHEQRFYCGMEDILRLLIHPIELGLLPGLNLVRLEPQSDLLLGILNAVAAVADVAADVLMLSVLYVYT